MITASYGLETDLKRWTDLTGCLESMLKMSSWEDWANRFEAVVGLRSQASKNEFQPVRVVVTLKQGISGSLCFDVQLPPR